MIDVVCVKWGTEYSDNYVHILKAMIERNTTIPHRFLCFSDTEIDGIETRALPEIDLKGWWNKLYLFSSGNKLSERIVYFDLDTVITGNIDFFLKYNGNFCGIENLGVHNKYEWGEHYKNIFQSGVMAWKKPWANFIWDVFKDQQFQIIKDVRGDGEFIHILFNKINKKPDLFQHLWPNKLKSYKYQVYDEGLDNTVIICFHGEPRPHQAINETTHPWGTKFEPRPWLANYWRL
jgi:hypothetical protein